MSQAKSRVLSGMRPTGRLHLGNLAGALSNWIRLQTEYECLFFVADWHALTTEYATPKELAQHTRDMVLDWLACGLDPERCTIFVQSRVPEHAELHVLLSMITPLSWLERVPTYKEQQQELADRDLSTYAFLGYPVLQAADILLYKADRVPVGEDQLPHLELTREIARRFNHLYGNLLPEPKALLTPTPKLPGPDGRKMSKSYGNAILPTEPAAAVTKKVRSMVTDPARVHVSDPGHPEVCTVYHFHEIYSPKERVETVARDCRGATLPCVDCKADLAKRLDGLLAPIREARTRLEADPARVDRIIDAGCRKAQSLARETLGQVRKALHLV